MLKPSCPYLSANRPASSRKVCLIQNGKTERTRCLRCKPSELAFITHLAATTLRELEVLVQLVIWRDDHRAIRHLVSPDLYWR
jgi:hypothetical protein